MRAENRPRSVHLFLWGCSALFIWQIVFTFGIGGVWDSSRYLFFASQFADYGNTYSMAYAPLFPFCLGFFQLLGFSAVTSVFIVYTISLGILLSCMFELFRLLSVHGLLIGLSFVALISSTAFYELINVALTELGFGALLTSALLLSLHSIRRQQIHPALLLVCALLPLQRYIGVVSANLCLLLTYFFLNQPLQDKVLRWLRALPVVHAPFLIVIWSNKVITKRFFGERRDGSDFGFGENIGKVFSTLLDEFPLELGFTVLSLLASITFVRRLSAQPTSWQRRLEVPIENPQHPNTLAFLLLLISSAMFWGHTATQIYSSSTVTINPINSRYFISFEGIFIVQLVTVILLFGTQIKNPDHAVILPRRMTAILLLLFPFFSSPLFAPDLLSGSPRALGHRHNKKINDVVNAVNNHPQTKHVALYELGKPHMPFFYLEIGMFDVLSPGCSGIQLLTPNANHYVPQTIAAPDCPDGQTSDNRFYLLREVNPDPRFTHILVSKQRLEPDTQKEMTRLLNNSGFDVSLSNKSYLLFARSTP